LPIGEPPPFRSVAASRRSPRPGRQGSPPPAANTEQGDPAAEIRPVELPLVDLLQLDQAAELLRWNPAAGCLYGWP
jgi:hypothetical protein